MDFMDVYTPYVMFFSGVITACVILSALFNAYLVLKVGRGSLFWSYLPVQAALLIWLFAKLLELVSPEQMYVSLNLAAQKAGVFLLIPALALFVFQLGKRGERLPVLCIGAAFLGALFWAFSVFIPVPELVSDLSPVCAFLLVNGAVFALRRCVFSELSDLSMDAYMDQIEDAILIFDPSGALIDRNQSAKSLFSLWEGFRNREDFFRILVSQTVSGGIPAPDAADPDPTELGLELPGGTRYFQCSATIVKNKNGKTSAYIMIFHDVTEKALLLRELESRNGRLEELNRQLESYIEVTSRLESEQERNRAVMEIHESIGQSIAELLIGLEALNALENTRDATVRQRLSEMIENCRDVMKVIRRSVEQLAYGNAGAGGERE